MLRRAEREDDASEEEGEEEGGLFTKSKGVGETLAEEERRLKREF